MKTLYNTKRLIVRALSIPEMKLFCQDELSLGKKLGYRILPITDEHLRDAYLEMCVAAENAGEEYIWHTIWLIIDTSMNALAGTLAFLGKPDKIGNAEFGYGINEEFRRKGYAEEAIGAVIEFAKDSNLQFLTAKTESDNIASQRLLEKCGFSISKTEDGVINFILRI